MAISGISLMMDRERQQAKDSVSTQHRFASKSLTQSKNTPLLIA